MAEPSTPPAEATGFEIDGRLKRTFLRILIIEAATVVALYWMSQYFT
jgi:hypothetical protein